MPRLVRQLSALMSTGRSGPPLWAALAGVLAAEYGIADSVGTRPRAGSVRVARGIPVLSPDRRSVPGHGTIQVVLAIQRATILGLPAADALRSACLEGVDHPGADPPYPGAAAPARMGGVDAGAIGGSSGRHGGLTKEERQTWLELAACLEICEASGAPVAAVLARLADRLDADEDAAAMRETALAGPRATVRLLTWLPFIGLGLGMAMGVDPVGVLLGGPLGWACLAIGLALVAAGKWWSGHLIATAAREPGAAALRGRVLAHRGGTGSGGGAAR
jgi:tight adherence protein B